MTQTEEFIRLADEWATDHQPPQAMSNECHGGGGGTTGKALGCEDLSDANETKQ